MATPKASAPRAAKSAASPSPTVENPERPGRTKEHEDAIVLAYKLAKQAHELIFDLPDDQKMNMSTAAGVANDLLDALCNDLRGEASNVLLDRLMEGREEAARPATPQTLAAHETELVEAFRSLVLGGDPAVYRRFIERLRLACVGSATHAAAQRVTDTPAEAAQCFNYLDPHAELVAMWETAGEEGTAPAVWSPVASAGTETGTAPTPNPGTIDATLAGVLTPAELAAVHAHVTRYAAQVRRVREMIAAVDEAHTEGPAYDPDHDDSWFVAETVGPIALTLQNVSLTPDRKPADRDAA